ncbi:hypothetical protein D3C72_585450 [compost metagenome]
MGGSHDHGQDSDLNPDEGAAHPVRFHADREIEPGQYQHQHEAGQHEAQPGEDAADPAFRPHAQVNAEFVGFRARKRLEDGEEPVEARARHPLIFVDQLAPDHGDLGDRTAEGQSAETQELQKKGGVAQERGARFDGIGGRHLASVSSLSACDYGAPWLVSRSIKRLDQVERLVECS